MQDLTKKIFEFGPQVNSMGQVFFLWSQDNYFVAICGENKNVYVIDRFQKLKTERGKKLREVALTNSAKVMGLSWDKDSEYLAIYQEKSKYVSIWNVFVEIKLTQIEIDNQKATVTNQFNSFIMSYQVSFIKWSKTHPVLAIGTDKGSLIFYNKKNQKKIPTMGKHAKKIISGDWNKDGLLITGGEDKILTVSNYNSDTQFESVSVKSEPKMIQWGYQKSDERNVIQSTIIAILQQKSLLMYEVNQPQKQPLELVFEQKYGKIVNYSLFGDGYIVVGFTEGYVAHISTLLKELKDEVCSEKIFGSTLDCLCTNDFLYKMAVAGEGCIKIYNLNTWKEIKNERIELPRNAGKVTDLAWAQNGQLLVAATSNGYLLGFLTSIPILTSEYGSKVAILKSFTEISIIDVNFENQEIGKVNLENEPGFLALGANHLATGMNNVVWYYYWRINKQSKLKQSTLILKRDYMFSIKKIYLNSYCVALLSEGKVLLHPIDSSLQAVTEAEQHFPLTENDKPIVNIGLTEQFLIMLDSAGKIKYWNIQEAQQILEYKSDYQLMRIFPNTFGTKLICVDNQGLGYIFSAQDEELIAIQSFPTKLKKIIWDIKDTAVFIALENESLMTFFINQNSLSGILVQPIRDLLSIEDLNATTQPIITTLDRGLEPLILKDGYLHCLTSLGTIQGQYLVSHSYLSQWKQGQDSTEGHYRYFLQNLMLNRYQFSFMAAEYLNDKVLFDTLGRKCLEALQFDIAIRCFQSAQNLSMVLTIQGFKDETEKTILQGVYQLDFGNFIQHIAMILGQYDQAQEYFLKSSNPQLALEMRSDIQDWLIALNLAKTIAPEQEPLICKRLALQIECQGNYNEAKRLYEKSLLKEPNNILDKKQTTQHNIQCYAGIARSSIKLGDVQRGFNIANDMLTDNQLIIDVAIICENMKQLYEAAQLFEKGQLFEKAAQLYIQLKMPHLATPLIEKIKSPKLLSQLAKEKESTQLYKEAEQLYERAEDWENVIRINVKYLANIDKAKMLVRTKCQSANSSSMIAQWCEKKKLLPDAIEFYLIGLKKEEAFILASTNNLMDIYVEFVTEPSPEQRTKISQHYEGQSQWGKAAKQYELMGNYQRALDLYIKSGETFLNDAIEMIGNLQNESMTKQLLDYIVSEGFNIIFIYQIYLKLRKYKEACKIAMTIAQDYQENNNNQKTQQFLFQAYQDLKGKINVPWELINSLMIIHSYLIAKKIIKLKEHVDAAKLLNRVCKNITQFHSQAVNILTSTVIEASRAGLKVNWSLNLCNFIQSISRFNGVEFQNQIPEQYKNRIENIARHPIQAKNEDTKSPCPFCKSLVSEYELQCDTCLNTIPFCIASGKHVVLDDCYFCKECQFPCIASYFKRIVAEDSLCPMCQAKIDISEVKDMIEPDALQLLKTFKENAEEKVKGESETKATDETDQDSQQQS